MRLNKFIAQCGVCSRRDADKLIEQGRVKVNGEIASMGMDVEDTDTIHINGKLINSKAQSGKAEKKVLAYYKPVGVTVTEKDAHAEKKITDMLNLPYRVTYAGRLDKDSEGLLILTNDGDLIDAMMRGANKHEKEYVVKVDKEITDLFLQKMSQGMYLKELKANTRPCIVKKEGKYTFNIILTQGLNRQIRRMCGALGFKVQKLKRIRVMNIKVDGIDYGKYRELEPDEVKELYRMAGL